MVVPKKAGRGGGGNKPIVFGGADNFHFLLGCSQEFILQKNGSGIFLTCGYQTWKCLQDLKSETKKIIEQYTCTNPLYEFPQRFSGKESTCQSKRWGFDPWVGMIPWRKKWQPSPVFLPEESHGQRSLVGLSPWGCKRVRHDLGIKKQHQAQ